MKKTIVFKKNENDPSLNAGRLVGKSYIYKEKVIVKIKLWKNRVIKRDCNFKWPFMYRRKFSIHNSTLETFINNKDVFNSDTSYTIMNINPTTLLRVPL